MSKWMILLTLCLSGLAWGATNTGTDADHDELRQLLVKARDAVNAGKPEQLEPYLHKDYAITVMTQELVTEAKPLKAWYRDWFTKPGAPLKRMRTEPTATILTNIYDGKFGICYGTSVDTYELNDGRTFRMDAKWTATVLKDAGGWKLLALHVGVNPIENPLIEAYRSGMGLGGVMIEIKRRLSQ